MDVILMHDHYDETHLEQVKSEMATFGTPKIKAVWMECFGAWCALEGCHRLRAAYALGLVPEMDEVEYDGDATSEDLGLDCDDVVTVDQILHNAHRRTTLTWED